MKLSTRYLLIIALSILIFPISYFGVNLAYYFLLTGVNDHTIEDAASSKVIHYDPDQLKKEWADKITELQGRSTEEILAGLRQANTYEDAYVEWIQSAGTVWTIREAAEMKEEWSVGDAIRYMQKGQDDGMYTASAYLQGNEAEGHAFLKVPERFIGSRWDVLRNKFIPLWLAMIGLIWTLVLFVSWLFFNKLRKRLVMMQSKMEITGEQGIPEMMEVRYEDEIGQLEHSFNRMVRQLQQSKEGERQETELRKSLMANLSHDLRTPLTVIRWHAYRLEQQSLLNEREKSVRVIQDKVDFLGELIDNLSSYTLLSNGKLPKLLEERDVRTIVRSSLSSWYVVFEEQGFEIEVELAHEFVWKVDKTWMLRILDNLFQNIMRHAADGKYVSVRTVRGSEEQGMLIISDHGPGLQADSTRKGNGIGLSIVTLMLEQMGLAFELDSHEQGTKALIYPNKSTAS